MWWRMLVQNLREFLVLIDSSIRASFISSFIWKFPQPIWKARLSVSLKVLDSREAGDLASPFGLSRQFARLGRLSWDADLAGAWAWPSV